MLQEVKSVRQNDGETFRRIYNDEEFYLIVWFDDEQKEVLSFQLFYTEENQRNCAVWEEGSPVSFRSVDDGEDRSFRYKMAAVMGSQVKAPSEMNVEKFKKSCRVLDFYIADKVVRSLQDLKIKNTS